MGYQIEQLISEKWKRVEGEGKKTEAGAVSEANQISKRDRLPVRVTRDGKTIYMVNA